MAVYVIQAETGACKVGFSRNPEARRVRLEAEMGCRLRLLHVWPGSTCLETALHARLARHRLHGEWFAPAPDLVSGAIVAAPDIAPLMKEPAPRPTTLRARDVVLNVLEAARGEAVPVERLLAETGCMSWPALSAHLSVLRRGGHQIVRADGGYLLAENAP